MSYFACNTRIQWPYAVVIPSTLSVGQFFNTSMRGVHMNTKFQFLLRREDSTAQVKALDVVYGDSSILLCESHENFFAQNSEFQTVRSGGAFS